MNGEVESTADGIEIYRDEKGNRLVIIGDTTFFVGNTGDVKDVVERLGLEDSPQQIPGYLKTLLGAGLEGASVLPSLLGKAEQWVKLTDKTFEAMKENGLMPTGVKGESFGMVDAPGQLKEWLRIDTGSLPQLSNQVNLVRFSNIMSAMARRYEVRRLHVQLNRIEGSLNKALQNQLENRKSDFQTSVRIVEEAWLVQEHGGDLETNWQKILLSYPKIAKGHDRAIDKLEDNLGILQDAKKLKELKELKEDEVQETIRDEFEILLYCFKLEQQRAVFEYARTLARKPEKADGQFKGLNETLNNRKREIADIAKKMVKELDDAGERAKKWALFHPGLANALVASFNEVAKEIESYFEILDVPIEERPQFSVITRGQVLRNSEALRAAGKEALPVAGKAVLAIAATAVAGSALRKGAGGELQSLMTGAINQIQKMPPAK